MKERNYSWRDHFNMGDKKRPKLPEIDLGPKSTKGRGREREGFEQTLDPYDYVAGNLLEGEAVSLNELISGLGENNMATRRRLDQILTRLQANIQNSQINTFTSIIEEDGEIIEKEMIQFIYE